MIVEAIVSLVCPGQIMRERDEDGMLTHRITVYMVY